MDGHPLQPEAPTAVPLRPASTVMRLARMGSLHQSRLSFMRVLLRRLKTNGWVFDRPLWRINEKGVGVATYRASGPERSYTLVAFAHDLPDDLRSDRVIAEAWDATFTLHDGDLSEADIDRLGDNVPIRRLAAFPKPSYLCRGQTDRSGFLIMLPPALLPAPNPMSRRLNLLAI